MGYSVATIRTALIDNEPWFVAADVARALGLTLVGGVRRHLGRLEQSEMKLIAKQGTAPAITAEATGNPRNLIVGVPLEFSKHESLLTLVNESGLYKLIMRSDKKEALEFQHWIASEVLPSIRKTGKYALGLPLRTRQIRSERRCRLSAGYVASRPCRRSTGFLGRFWAGGRGAEVGAWWPRNASLENDDKSV